MNEIVQENNKKIKILTISDHPLSPSGVGNQTKYFIVEMLKTGKFQFVSIGGAIKHDNYNPVKMEEFGDDWIIYPLDGYGSQETLRSLLRSHKPDILWFMTDPRFFSLVVGNRKRTSSFGSDDLLSCVGQFSISNF